MSLLGELLTLGEFIARAQHEFNASLKEKRIGIVTADGALTVRWLERTLENGQQRKAVIRDNLVDGQPLNGYDLRSLCSQLNLPTAAFGLMLEDPS